MQGQLSDAGLNCLHSHLVPSLTDLLDDFGLIDSYLIDGDSLLMHLLDSPRMDWSHGGQFLQLFYSLEQLVCALKHCNASFAIVFFRQSALQHLSSTAVMLARQLLIKHLKSCQIQLITEISSWCDPAWSDQLEQIKAKFILLADSAADGPLAACMRLHQLWTLSMGVKCAYFSNLTFAEDRMHGFCIGHLAGMTPERRLWVRQQCILLGEASLPAADSIPMFSKLSVSAPSELSVCGDSGQSAHGLQHAVIASNIIFRGLSDNEHSAQLVRICTDHNAAQAAHARTSLSSTLRI